MRARKAFFSWTTHLTGVFCFRSAAAVRRANPSAHPGGRISSPVGHRCDRHRSRLPPLRHHFRRLGGE
jgi:hypothetical protein